MDSQEISLTFKNKIENLNELKKYEERLTKINSQISAIKSGQKGVSGLEKETKTTQKAVDSTTKSVEKMGKQLDFTFNISAMTAYTKALTGLFTKLSSFTMKSTNYIENVNLLEVAYHNANETIEESSTRIEDFIDKMSEVYGLDESDLARKLGIFKQLANAMQLPTQEAEHLSELMVKMTNDVASLYNLDLNRASNALQSALAGQVRPIRSATGADITEKTLQQTVDALGLDRTINELSFVEKRLVMVISLTNQLKNSQGDYARTIESASNQIRIMKEQFERLSRAVGNTLYPILQGIMPYINGILMALTEVFNLIASLLGFKMPEFDYEGLSAVSDYAMDIEDGLNGAGDSADKLNNKLKGLRGFDKLNVINTPTSSSSAGGGAGGIDPTIMDAFNKAFSEYDDKMNSVRMKAHDIRDSIMEWLGFTKLVNEETGKITWIYNGSNELVDNIVETVKNAIPHLQKIWDYSTKIFGGVIKEFFKDLASGPYGKIMEAMLSVIEEIFKIIANNEFLIKMIAKLLELKLLTGFIKNIEKIGKALGGSGSTGLFGIIKKLYNPTVNLFKAMVNGSKDASIGIKNSITNWRTMNGILDAGSGKIAGISGAFAMLKTSLLGIGGALLGLTTFNTALEDINTNGLNLMNITGGLGGAFTTIVSSITAGASMFGTVGAVIGGVVSGVGLLIDAIGIFGSKQEEINPVVQETNSMLETYDENLKKVRESAEKQVESTFAQVDRMKELTSELSNYVDENGNVISSTDRVNEIIKILNDNLGTEYEVTGNTITANGEKIGTYQQLQGEIDKYCEKLRAMALIEAYQEEYNAKVAENLSLKKQLTKTQIEINKSLSDAGLTEGTVTASWIEDNKDLLSSYADLDKKIKDNSDYATAYEKASIEAQNGNYKEAEKLLSMSFDSTKKSSEEVLETIKNNNVKFVDDSHKKAKEAREKMQNELDKLKHRYDIRFIGNFDDIYTKLNDIQNRASYMKIGGKANGGVFANGQWNDVTAYGTGGLPPVGQMFVARERGPELVGTIGGHTAVMNNDQIVGSVSNGVYQAVRSAMGNQNQGSQIFNIYLDEEHKIGTYTLDQLQNMAKSNGKAITLG